MMMKIWKMMLFLLCIGVQEAHGQKEITLPTPRKYQPKEFVQQRNDFANDLLDNTFVVLVDLEEVPSKASKALMQRHNIQLKYQTENTYQAIIPTTVPATVLDQLGVISIRKNIVENKISSAIKNNDYPTHAVKAPNTVEVAILINEHITEETIQKLILSFQLSHLQKPLKGGKLLQGRIAQNRVMDLAASPAVEYIDVINSPVVQLNHENRVLQRANVLTASFAGERNLSGEGICVGVGDGGELGNHLDFQDRVINYANGTYTSFGAHGDHVAGTIGAAGLVDPVHRGLAPSTQIITEKTTSIISNSEDFYNDHGMVLTNNSYGVGYNCETNGTYNYTSNNLDWQMREFPYLLHVFASGNSGYSVCGNYPAGYKSVLRYYQSAKNVLTVGNAKQDRTLNGGSSKGPVSDGRIKPEIVGIGSNVMSTGRNYDYYSGTGTSMASPSVTGTLALINERYKQLNADQKAEGALIKAVACNTADDEGNIGPDYAYGFGIINGKRAVEVLENSQYKKATLSDSENHTATIDIPAGMGQVKVMLYWHDKEAIAYPTKALVNDLDLTLTTPTGTVLNPWVLNHDTLNVLDLPTRQVDTLNNIEQVTLNNPAPGTYTITVNGTLIPEGPQDFFITWDFVTTNVDLTFPYGNEKFNPGDVQLIQWDVDKANTQNFTIEYSVNNGGNWNLIDNNVDAQSRHYAWNVPNVTTEAGVIRITKNGNAQTSANTQPFIILERPTNLVTDAVCEGYVELSWDAITDANAYEIFKYEGTEMVSLGTVSSNSHLTDALPIGEVFWYAVSAVLPSGKTSERSVAIQVISEIGGSCPWDYDLNLRQVEVVSAGRKHTVSELNSTEVIALDIKNIGINEINSFEIQYQINGGTMVTQQVNQTIASGDSLVVSFATTADLSATGNYQLDAWVNIPQEANIHNNSIVGQIEIKHISNNMVVLPFVENFESGTATTYGDAQMGLDGLPSWDFAPDANGELTCVNEGSNRCLEIGNFTSTTSDKGITMTLNLSNYEVNDELVLEFDHKYIYPSVIGEGDVVYIRGSDMDDWIELFTMNPLPAWIENSDLDVSTVLADNGQALSSSFQIHFSQGKNTAYAIDNIELSAMTQPLPVEMTYFTATRQDKDALLKWETANETNNAYFEIELTTEPNPIVDENFEVVGRVEGHGTTSQTHQYSFVDNRPNKTGVHYYRLKQVNLDGSFEYSDVRAVKFNEHSKLLIYPNPFTTQLNILDKNKSEGIREIELIDTHGRVVFQKNITSDSSEEILLELNARLAVGTYILRIISTEKTTSFPLMKASQ